MWEVSLSIIGFDGFVAHMVAMMRDGGSSAAEIAEMRAFFATSYRNPAMRIPVSMSEILPVGILVSLVSAALLRNPRFMPARAA